MGSSVTAAFPLVLCSHSKVLRPSGRWEPGCAAVLCHTAGRLVLLLEVWQC